MTAAIFLVLLAYLTASARSAGIYVPVGVGEPQEGRNLSGTPFGSFLDEFAMCGKRTTQRLNEQFKGMNLEVEVRCEPSPTRILLAASGANVDFGRFERKMTEECELFTCSADANAPDVSAASNVCNGKSAGYSAGATGNALFANEDMCWAREKSLEATLASGKFVQVPRWLKAGQERLNIRNTFFTSEKLNHAERVPYSFRPVSEFGKATYKQCRTACDKGSLVKLIMKPNAYRMMIYVKPTCRSFKICFNPDGFNIEQQIPVCNVDRQIDVLVQNGVVVFAKKGRASLIELVSPYHSGSAPVPIEFGYGVQVGDVVKSDFYIGNDHREFVMSDSQGFVSTDVDKLAFFFSQPDCLMETAGIFSKNIENGETLTDKDVTVVGTSYDAQGEPINGPQAEEATTSTTKEPAIALVATTTPAPLRVAPENLHLDGGDADSNNMSMASYTPGKWWTWGIYIGFVISTILTLVLGSAVFYFIRRTVFGIWYRGMYKRYGCDVDGTTAGLTGIGFDNAVTGTQTVATGATGATVGGATEATSQSTLLPSTSKTLGM